MLPTSSPRLVLENRTNFFQTPSQPKPFFSKLHTPPEDRNVKRRAATLDDGPKKRLKLEFEKAISEYPYDSDDSDVEMEDVVVARARSGKLVPFQRNTLSIRSPGNFRQPDSK
jgi:denticleless